MKVQTVIRASGAPAPLLAPTQSLTNLAVLTVAALALLASAAIAAPQPSADLDALPLLADGWEVYSGPEPSPEGPLGLSELARGVNGWSDLPATHSQRPFHGTRWYRNQFHWTPQVPGDDLALLMELQGSAQVFIDGRLSNNLGRLELATPAGGATDFGSRSQLVRGIEPGQHEIILRYRPDHTSFAWVAPSAGFRLHLGAPDLIAQTAASVASAGSRFQALFVGAFLSQAILHLLLFIYLPRFKSNAWFALNSVLSALLVGLYFQRSLSESPTFLGTSQQIWNLLLLATMVVLLQVIYEVYDRQRGRVFWGLAVLGGALAIGVSTLRNVDAFGLFWWFHVLILVEALRVNGIAIRSGWRGSWLIGTGLALLTSTLVWQYLLVAGVLQQPFRLFPIAYIGVGLFLFSVSAYLARKFAQAGETLAERAVQIEELSAEKLERELETRLLEADNGRKTAELETARELQLSLLPRSLPDLPHLEIAVCMTTATEVGGDFYDFHTSDSGALSVAIGDAAGHGAGAGSMVSLMKGLFSNFRAGRDIRRFFAQSNDAIRSMKLSGANTAMAIAHLDPDRLTYGAAGIPPALVYRAATKTVDEVLVEGMPLGSLANYPFKQRIVDIDPGDMVLLMSDGLAELPDAAGESFGYDRVQEVVAVAASGSPQELVDRLMDEANNWFGAPPYPDDVTLVALKVLRPFSADDNLAALESFLPID